LTLAAMRVVHSARPVAAKRREPVPLMGLAAPGYGLMQKTGARRSG